jgi:hypothetical protein
MQPPKPKKRFKKDYLLEYVEPPEPTEVVIKLGFDKGRMTKSATGMIGGQSRGNPKNIPDGCPDPLTLFQMMKNGIDDEILKYTNNNNSEEDLEEAQLRAEATAEQEDPLEEEINLLEDEVQMLHVTDYIEESDEENEAEDTRRVQEHGEVAEVEHEVDSNVGAASSTRSDKSHPSGLTHPQLLRFQAFLLGTGLVKLPSLRDYYRTDDVGHQLYHTEFIPSLGSREGMKKIRSVLRVPAKRIVQLFGENARLHWDHGSVVVDDECIMGFLGRWCNKVHVKNKPNEDGVKLYFSADNLRYCFDAWLYEGSDSIRSTKLKDIVLDFAKNTDTAIPYIIVADSHFGFLEVALELDKMGLDFILACGMKNPSALFMNYLHTVVTHRGDFSCCTNGRITAITFKDRGMLNLLTNMVDGHLIDQDYITAAGKNFPLPKTVALYRRLLGAVDSFDHLLQQYCSKIKCYKWTHVVLKAVLHMCVVNAWKIHCALNPAQGQLSLKRFQETLAIQLKQQADALEPQLPAKRRRLDSAQHVIFRAEHHLRCHYCYSKKISSTTPYSCISCNIPLHADCFYEFHKDLLHN